MAMAFMTNDRGSAMSKIGPREAQLRALKEARYEERQQRLRQITQPAEPVAPVTNRQSVTNNVTNQRAGTVTNRPAAPSDKARVARWRAANPERYRTYMRNLMREIRAKQKEAAA
jgi:hypothetical protein